MKVLNAEEISRYHKIANEQYIPLRDKIVKTELEERRLLRLKIELEPYRQHLLRHFREKYGWDLG